MDRLITELQLQPAEAYVHLSRLIEQLNAVVGSFFRGELMERGHRLQEKPKATDADKVAAELQESDPNFSTVGDDEDLKTPRTEQ